MHSFINLLCKPDLTMNDNFQFGIKFLESHKQFASPPSTFIGDASSRKQHHAFEPILK